MRNTIIVAIIISFLNSCMQENGGGKIEKIEKYPNGSIKSIKTIDTLNRTSKFVAYHPNGKIGYELFYANGLREGKSYSYDTNGVLFFEGVYVHDTLNGPVIEYYPDGKVKIISSFLKGKEKSQIHYDKNQKIIDAFYPFVTIRALKDTVKLGEIYYSKVFFNALPFYEDGKIEMCNVIKVAYENGKRVEYCPNMEVKGNVGFYSAKAEILGENIYLGNAFFTKYDNELKDSAVYWFNTSFEGRFFVVK